MSQDDDFKAQTEVSLLNPEFRTRGTRQYHDEEKMKKKIRKQLHVAQKVEMFKTWKTHSLKILRDLSS